jgi:hypothetical protein
MLEKGITEVCTLRAIALHAVCKQQATLDAALLQDVLSLVPLGRHHVSPTAFVDLAEAADGTRTAQVGSIVQIRDVEGRLVVEAWYVRGELHREDGPAWRKWDAEGRLVEEKWYVRGELHRGDGPAWRRWDSAGRLVKEKWFVRGQRQRADGPVFRTWDAEGRLVFQAESVHRQNGPARQEWGVINRRRTAERWGHNIQFKG